MTKSGKRPKSGEPMGVGKKRGGGGVFWWEFSGASAFWKKSSVASLQTLCQPLLIHPCHLSKSSLWLVFFGWGAVAQWRSPFCIMIIFVFIFRSASWSSVRCCGTHMAETCLSCQNYENCGCSNVYFTSCETGCSEQPPRCLCDRHESVFLQVTVRLWWILAITTRIVITASQPTGDISITNFWT
jgi:hypothetical protein